MQPIGRIMSHTKPPLTETSFTQVEQTTVMSLWCITGAPLMFGGRLPLLDNETFTLSLLTNSDVLNIHNLGNTIARYPFNTTGGVTVGQYAWAAQTPASGATVALFNAADNVQQLTINLTDAGLQPNTEYCVYDLWLQRDLPGKYTSMFDVDLTMHGSGMYRFTPCS
jgi:alpha-galactosidase